MPKQNSKAKKPQTKKSPTSKNGSRAAAAVSPKTPRNGGNLSAKTATPGKRGRALPKALSVNEVYRACPVGQFKFKDTAHFDKTHDIIAQDRAVRAINMGLGIRKPGYNIYVAGYQGTGKTSVIRTFLERWSEDASTPPDWVYVYNFDDQENPNAIKLDAGGARKFAKKMDQLVKNLRQEIPIALQSEDYENTVNAYISASNDRKSKLFSNLEKRAKSMDFIIKSSRIGIETIPVHDGRPLTEKEYGKLTDEEREIIEDRRSQLEPEVLDFARRVRAIEQETAEYIEKLRSELGMTVVGAQIDPLIDAYKPNPEISAFLEKVKEHVLENLLDFVEEEEGSGEQDGYVLIQDERDKFRKYKVNVFIDNKSTKGAPVIIETNPTYYNLFGRIDKNVEHGMYLTDFTMIKAGSIHRANGGYLVLNAMDIFKTPSIWDTLKRILKNRLGFIEDMGEQYSLLPTSGLRPEPVPLDVKVILIGSSDIYHILYDADEEFPKIFKIKADFDYKMPRNPVNVGAYAAFVGTRTHLEDLTPFDRSGVAAIVEFGSRLVEDQRFLSTQFGDLKDLTIEADFLAREKESQFVTRDEVEEALDQKYYRLNLVEEHLLEMVQNEDILLQIEGEQIGQVNGLTVYDMGDYSFGKIGRVTCTTSLNDEGIFNIDRASKLSGKIHDKGMYILTGYLNAMLAQTDGVSFSASVCFEQSYGIVDGDSATITELVAIISSLGRIPVRQNLAMTGSLNQFGDVQPVGGINEKLEGFFKTVRMIGKESGSYSVLIPHQNVQNLMLHREVRDAVNSGFIKIFPVKTFAEVFEIATGVPLGVRSVHDLAFDKGSAMDILRQKFERAKKEHEESPAKEHHNIPKYSAGTAAAKRSGPPGKKTGDKKTGGKKTSSKKRASARLST